MHEVVDSDVAKVFQSYPEPICSKILLMRELIMEAATETEGIGVIEETLKWGEPSYLTKSGSTVRVGWKASKPDQYAVLFRVSSESITN